MRVQPACDAEFAARPPMTEKGYIQFECRCVKGAPPSSSELTLLSYWRARCYEHGLCGVYDDGIGYGNLSVRIPGTSGFIITGTQTGSLDKLRQVHYAKVIDFDIARNTVVAVGPVSASSESLSHAALYSTSRRINAIIHAHDHAIWSSLLNRAPTTDPSVEAGTPEMGYELMRVAGDVGESEKLIVMGGHQDGVIAFGAGLDEAGRTLFEALRRARG